MGLQKIYQKIIPSILDKNVLFVRIKLLILKAFIALASGISLRYMVRNNSFLMHERQSQQIRS